MPQVAGVRHRFVPAGGLNFHVAEAGEGEPVLLLHGWPQHWYAWRLVIPALAERYRVLAVDLRGFGWSDIAWEGFEKENMADDVANVMAALEVDRRGSSATTGAPGSATCSRAGDRSWSSGW
jgi:pimeloyl-ACP methyl ester carboxylesterase